MSKEEKEKGNNTLVLNKQKLYKRQESIIKDAIKQNRRIPIFYLKKLEIEESCFGIGSKEAKETWNIVCNFSFMF